jgi:protein-disulfide isomerase
VSADATEERRQRLVKLGSATAFLAIVAIAVLIVVSQSGGGGGDAGSVEGAAEIRAELRGIPQRGLVLGDPGAAVTLVEFGDLQCPVCKGYAEEIVPSVIDSKIRSGEARLAFRNFTIINEESIDAAAAAIAAGEQGRGWDFLEFFYRNQGSEASGYVTDEFMTAIAEGAGVPDIARWNAARLSDAVIEQVEAETAEAEGLGLSGTPSFVIEGPLVDEGRDVLGTPGSAGPLEAAIEGAG